MNLATLPLPGRRLAARVYHHIVPRKRHADIRAYAAFAREHGLEHIHYGYWHPGDEVKAAQDQLYERVEMLIPAGVVNVLDVGGGIGGASERLRMHGYRPLCIVPDPDLVAQGRERFPQVPFVEATAEDFRVGDQFDAALFIESYQYFSKKAHALRNIVKHLTLRAGLIFAEEFALIPGSRLPNEMDLISLLGACGRKLNTRVDISERILPTCKYVYETLTEKAPQLAEVWRQNELEYLAGQRQYLLLRFQPGS